MYMKEGPETILKNGVNMQAVNLAPQTNLHGSFMYNLSKKEASSLLSTDPALAFSLHWLS